MENEIIATIDSARKGFELINGKNILSDGNMFNFDKLSLIIVQSKYSTGISGIIVTPIGASLEIKYGHNLIFSVDRAACNAQLTTAGTDCLTLLQEFMSIYTYAHNTLASPLALKHHLYLVKLEKDWDDFLDNSKSQMPWEMLINGWRFKQDQKPGLWSPPPEDQIIFFHPSIVIENVSDAIDGENTEEALMLEVIGYNSWQSENWYTPTGASLVTLYADRNQTKDWGMGVAIHFDNNLTVGFSRHDDENGVFVSVDLWKLFTDKKSVLERYGINND